MKLLRAPLPALIALFLAAALPIHAHAQNPPAQSPTQQPSTQKPAPQQPAPQPPPSNPHSHVLFSRSTDENGETTTVGPAAQLPSAAAAPLATDAEREAVTFTAYDLDVHLEPARQYLAVRAQLTVRNDGAAPLAHIPLQISSSLDWEHIRIDTRDPGTREVEARDVPFQTATLNSDGDHTGQLHEAAVPLGQPLAPGASLTLTVAYSGAIPQSAQRLLALGAPESVALHSDWDEIGLDFTGLRGFGNVVWVPVSSVPALLGVSQAGAGMAWQPAGSASVDSARLFDQIGQLKLRNQAAHFRLRLTDEFPLGHAPPAAHMVAVINGIPAPLTLIEPPHASGETSGFATAELDEDALGFAAPSLFVATRTPAQIQNATLWMRTEDAAATSSWSAADDKVTPFLQSWLGDHPRAPLAVLDLPDPADAPFETGALLATPLGAMSSTNSETAAELDTILVHALTRAWLAAPGHAKPAWLDEGLAGFLGSLWIEKQQGRERALESLEADRQALTLAEPASPGENLGPDSTQPLAEAWAPVYYRTKAAYVFWMLRDLAGEAALSAALRAYDSAKEDARSTGPGEFERLVESSAGANSGHDLRWFFSDWVDADKGLPDLSIDHVATEPAQGGETLVGVTLSNSGYAAAEVPVTVRTRETAVTQRILVPARGSVIRRILIQGTPTQVQANDGSVPETEASVHITNLNGVQ